MSSIIFIHNPVFVVDFSQYHPEIPKQSCLNTVEKIKNFIGFSFESIGFFYVALGKSLYETGRFSGISFKQIVLGWYGSLSNYRPTYDIALIILKIGVWILGMGLNVVTTTGRLWWEHMYPQKPESAVKNYIEKEIDIDHLRTNDFELDASCVPSDLKVESLKEMFKMINFDDSQAPGYMPPSTRKEGKTIYTKEELVDSLQTFIGRVNKREAFLGTPPSYDTPRLMAFYQQIENAVRLSIYHIQGKLTIFENQNGTDPSVYSPNQLSEYKNILEDRARILIDLAIAGKHCGARYMGESMTAYSNTIGENLSADLNLEETIIELLAKKRREIAEQHIQIHLGIDTHSYANYMGTLGESLAIPGTKNVIEHLAFSLDEHKFKQLFFADYTVATIIDAIQAKVKKSNDFREKIIDWLKAQMNSWSHLTVEETEMLTDSIVYQIEEIIKQAKDESHFKSSPIRNLHALLFDLKAKGIRLPSIDNGWGEFLEHLMVIEEVKQWCHEKLPNPSSSVNFQIGEQLKRNGFKVGCSEAKLGTDVIRKIMAQIQENGVFSEEEFQLGDLTQKIDEVRSFFSLKQLPAPSDDTIRRMIFRQTFPQDVIEGLLQSAREGKFLEELKLESIHENGLSPQLMEWLLVSHKIFLPQKQIEKKQVSVCNASQLILIIEQSIPVGFPSLSLVKEWFRSLKTASKDEIEEGARVVLEKIYEGKSRRFPIGVSSRDQLLELIFIKSYKEAPSEIDRVVNAISQEREQVFAGLKHVLEISLARNVGSLTGLYLFKMAVFCASLAYIIILGMRFYGSASRFVITKALPFYINHTPLVAVKTVNGILNTGSYLYRNRFKIMLCFWVFEKSLARLPEISYVTRYMRQVSLDSVFNLFRSGTSITGFLMNEGLRRALFTWNVCTSISNYCKEIAKKAESEKLRMSREKGLSILLASGGSATTSC